MGSLANEEEPGEWADSVDDRSGRWKVQNSKRFLMTIAFRKKCINNHCVGNSYCTNLERELL